MPRIHKTMRGNKVNMDQLRIKNEKVVAVGNMNVNAGGDEIGAGGKVTKDRNQRVREDNALHTMIPDKVKVQPNSKAVAKHATEQQDEVIAQETAAKILADADIPVVDANEKPKGGLAASMAENEKKK